MLKRKIFYTTYKFKLCEISEIFYSQDKAYSFFEKIANFNSAVSHSTTDKIKLFINKYFPNLNEKLLENLTTKDILLSTETEAESINGFRKMEDNNNIKINFNSLAYAYGLPLKILSHYDYTYTKGASYKSQCKKMNKSGPSIYNLFPIEHLNTYFLSKKGYKLATKLPTILCKLERILLPLDLCLDFNILITPQINCKLPVTFKKIEKFLWATTAPGVLEHYNFETLETLGDSIIKFILSLIVMLNNPNDTEGALQSKRSDLLKNDKLQELGINSQLYKYVLNQRIKLVNWTPPLKRSFKQVFEQTTTKKCAADILEAFVGACFLSDKNLDNCYSIMVKLGIMEKDKHESIFKNKIIVDNCIKDFSHNNIINYDISFYDLFYYYRYQDNSKINIERSCIYKIIDEKGVINKKVVKIIENRINYKFINPELLLTAMTHPSYNKEISKNYQQLELLGDAVLEVYLIIRLFLKFENKIFSFDPLDLEETINSDYFTCGNLTHAKSILASNNFLIKISMILGLHEFILLNDKKNFDSINSFFSEKNIEINLKQRVNEYENDPMNCQKPKILSDIFESLLGAILMDSDLKNCFYVLDLIFKPFINYTAQNFDKLKYSPISEFLEVCSKVYGLCPKFSRGEINGKMYRIDAWVGDKLISSGSAVNEDRAKEISAIEGIKKIKFLFD